MKNQLHGINGSINLCWPERGRHLKNIWRNLLEIFKLSIWLRTADLSSHLTWTLTPFLFFLAMQHGLWNLSSLTTRDPTWALGSESAVSSHFNLSMLGLLHWQVDSSPLSHQRSPNLVITQQFYVWQPPHPPPVKILQHWCSMEHSGTEQYITTCKAFPLLIYFRMTLWGGSSLSPCYRWGSWNRARCTASQCWN